MQPKLPYWLVEVSEWKLHISLHVPFHSAYLPKNNHWALITMYTKNQQQFSLTVSASSSHLKLVYQPTFSSWRLYWQPTINKVYYYTLDQGNSISNKTVLYLNCRNSCLRLNSMKVIALSSQRIFNFAICVYTYIRRCYL